MTVKGLHSSVSTIVLAQSAILRAAPECILGVDCGTSRVSASVVSAAGNVRVTRTAIFRALKQ